MQIKNRPVLAGRFSFWLILIRRCRSAATTIRRDGAGSRWRFPYLTAEPGQGLAMVLTDRL
jgi:hypothetical protein